MTEYVEYQLVSPGGTVLWALNVPAGHSCTMPIWDDPIEGPVLARWRDRPQGEWVISMEYPEGYPGPGYLPGQAQL